MVGRYACGLDIILRLFFSLFSQVELSHFSGIIYNNVNGQGIPCWLNSSYSFILILLKLHWCFGHGLKICMWFGYNPQIIFCHFFCKLNLAIFPTLSITNEWTGDTLLAQLLQFYTDSFETLLVFWSWSEDMHVVKV